MSWAKNRADFIAHTEKLKRRRIFGTMSQQEFITEDARYRLANGIRLEPNHDFAIIEEYKNDVRG